MAAFDLNIVERGKVGKSFNGKTRHSTQGKIKQMNERFTGLKLLKKEHLLQMLT